MEKGPEPEPDRAHVERGGPWAHLRFRVIDSPTRWHTRYMGAQLTRAASSLTLVCVAAGCDNEPRCPSASTDASFGLPPRVVLEYFRWPDGCEGACWELVDRFEASSFDPIRSATTWTSANGGRCMATTCS